MSTRRFIFAPFFVVYMISGSMRWAVAQSVSVSAKPAARQFLPYEPVWTIITITKRSQSPLFIPFPVERNLRVEVTTPRGDVLKAGFGPDSQSVGSQSTPLGPRQKILLLVNLLDSGAVTHETGTFDVSIVFDTRESARRESGLFSSRITGFKLAIRIVPPKGMDRRAVQFLEGQLKTHSNSICYFWDTADPSVHEQLIRDFPFSAYAIYARFYLADHHRTFYGERLGRRDFIEQAIEEYGSVTSLYPGSSVAQQAHWGIARCLFLKKDYASSSKAAQSITRIFPGTYAAQEAAKLESEITEMTRLPNESPGKPPK